MVKNLLCNAGAMGFIPGWGTKIPCTTEQLSSCATTIEPMYSKVHVLQLQKLAHSGEHSTEPERPCALMMRFCKIQ